MAVKLIDELQKEIKAASEAVTQEAYEKAYDHVFQILDNLEKLLNDNRYLEGNEITEEEWFAERGVKKIFINSRTEAVGFYEKLGYVADPKQITGIGAFQCIMTEKQL